MNYLLSYALSIVTSLLLEKYQDLKTIKDMADNGYILNLHDRNNLNNNAQDNNLLYIRNLYLIIPFVNIYFAIENIYLYNKSKDYIHDILESNGTFVKMNDKEIELYNNNSNAFNALKIAINSELLLSNSLSIPVEMLGKDGNIYFNLNDANINILRTTGIASRLTHEEQLEMINEKVDIVKIDDNELNNLEEFKIKTIKYEEELLTIEFTYKEKCGKASFGVSEDGNNLLITKKEGIACEFNQEVFEIIFKLLMRYLLIQEVNDELDDIKNEKDENKRIRKK